MSITMYNASVSVFQKMLGNLSIILDKAESHAAARKIDPAALLQSRLFPDMFTFTKQIQIACDFAKGATARLGGVEVPKFDDSEASFADMKSRIAKTLAFIATVPPSKIEGSAGNTISVTMGGKPYTYDGLTYLNHIVMPNFYFHLTTAYALLRHNGVEIGKYDFIGKV
jgi:hypothetical protein